MKNRLMIIALPLALGLLSSCGHYSYTYQIDGVTYKTGFYNDLWVEGISGRQEDAAIDTDTHLWWKVEGGEYDLYASLHREALWWNPYIYCKEDEYEEVETYYHDSTNYDFYIGQYIYDENDVKLGEEHREMADKAVEFNIQTYTSNNASVFYDDPLRGKNITIPYNEEENGYPPRVTLYRTSKDGFFTTAHQEVIVVDKHLYVIAGPSEDNFLNVYPFEDEVSDYMVNLFEQYGLLNAE